MNRNSAIAKHNVSARLLVLAAFGVLLFATESRAQFHDQGLQYAKIRTDYNATNEGTASNPITLVSPCLFPPDDIVYPPPASPGPDGIFLVDNRCVTSAPVHAHSNYFQQNGGGSSPTFWVLSMNNEPWDSGANTGPPNQSLARSLPGQGVMGFSAIIDYAAGENFWRLHKVLNHAFSNPVGQDAIPFLAVGAVENRGNSGRVGTFNMASEPHVVAFTDKLWDYNVGMGSTWLVSHFLFATAEWGGKARMLFIHLFYDGQIHGQPWNGWSAIDENGSGSAGGAKGWNWPMQESFWYPGANIAFMDAAAMSLPQVCNMNLPQFQYIGQQINYFIDLEKAFRCASDHQYFETSMPQTAPVALTGVYWGVELTGPAAAIWTSVHNMRMLEPLPPNPCWPNPCLQRTVDAAPPEAVLPHVANGEAMGERITVAAIHRALDTSCAAMLGCTEANALTVPGAFIGEHKRGGRSGTIRELVEPIKHGLNTGD